MEDIEKKLLSMGKGPVAVPDSDEFVKILHRRIGHIEAARQRLFTATSAIVVVAVLAAGLFQNLRNRTFVADEVRTEFYFLANGEEAELYEDSLTVDEAFVLEAADYLIQRMKFATEDWEILEDLEELGILDLSEPNERGESS